MCNTTIGELAATRWRSRFGRPTKMPKLGDVDVTGSYCPVPEEWLKRKVGRHLTLISKHVSAFLFN